MKILPVAPMCLVSFAFLPSAALADDADVRTVDATTVPVLSVTSVVSRTQPNAAEFCYPDNGRHGDPRRYTVTFDIEPDGTTSNVHAPDRIGLVDECAGAAERAVRLWKFEPPRLNGEPVRVTDAETLIGYEPRRTSRAPL